MPLFLTPPKPIYHFLYIYFCSKKKARVAFSLLLIHPGTEESLCLKKQPPPPLQLSTEIHANCLKVQNLEFRLHFILQVSLIRKGQWIIKSATCFLTKLLWSLHMKWCYSVNKWNSYFYIIIHNIIYRCTHIYSHTHIGTFKGTSWKQTEMPQIKCLLRRSSFIIIKCEKYASSIKYSDQEKAIIHLLQPDVQGEQYFVLFYPNPFHLPGFHWCPAKNPYIYTCILLLFIHAGLEKWSNLLSFRSSTERHFTSTALSFISRPYFFFPPQSIHTPRSHCKLDMPRGSAVCNLKSAQSLKLYAILRSRSLFSV